MIVDTLAQCSRYAALSPYFIAAFDYLQKLPADQPPGRYDLKGQPGFVLVQSYRTKPVAAPDFEVHRKYIDIQFIQSGFETILWSPLSVLTENVQPYHEGNDIAFFAAPPQSAPISLSAGSFAIFFPTDAHAPGLAWGDPVHVRKVVVKIPN